MRAWTATAVALSFLAFGTGGVRHAGAAGLDRGRLSGVTQISYGCPGPQREGEPCESWSSFPDARFRLTALRSGDARIVTSNWRGRFTLLLTNGRYRLTPLRQPHTTGGPALTVTIRVTKTTWTRIRFEGYPRML